MYKLNSARILPILDIEEVFNSKFIEFGDILSLKGQSTKKGGNALAIIGYERP